MALLTTFQLLVGDAWSGVVFNAVYTSDGLQRKFLAVAFLVAWIIFATFVLTNIFIAVIIENFDVSETIADIDKPGNVRGMRKFVSDAWKNYYVTRMAYRRGDIVKDRVTGKYFLHNGQYLASPLSALHRLLLPRSTPEAYPKGVSKALAET